MPRHAVVSLRDDCSPSERNAQRVFAFESLHGSHKEAWQAAMAMARDSHSPRGDLFGIIEVVDPSTLPEHRHRTISTGPK